MNTQAALTILSQLRRSPGSSRRDLEEATGLHVNTVARTVGALIGKGYVREGAVTRPNGRGRPQIPLEFDTERVCIGGIAIGPGTLECIHTDILGRPVCTVYRQQVSHVKILPGMLSKMITSLMQKSPLCVGICVTGVVEPRSKRILFSSVAPEQEISLASSLRRLGQTPVVLDSEMHALSARWLMSHGQMEDEDVLVVILEDGAVGASLLVAGRPNRGCVLGGNELGHMRLAVKTDPCYCGGVGCVERIFSTPYFQKLAGRGRIDLAAAFAGPQLSSAAKQVLKLTAQALANVAIFVRPHRVVVVGSLAANPFFKVLFEQAWRAGLLPVFKNRIQLDWWPIQATISAETAAWLAISRVIKGDGAGGGISPRRSVDYTRN